MRREVELMKKYAAITNKNENIVDVVYVHIDDSKIAIVMEWCETDLEQEMKKYSPQNLMPVERAIKIIKDVIHGYRYLYKNDLIHRDLKPANILILDDKYKVRCSH